MYYKGERQQRREFEQAVEARKKQGKRDAWLRELEIRDQEDKEWRERHAAIEVAAREAGKRQSTTTPAASTNSEAESASTPGGGTKASSEKKDSGSVVESVKALVGGEKK